MSFLESDPRVSDQLLLPCTVARHDDDLGAAAPGTPKKDSTFSPPTADPILQEPRAVLPGAPLLWGRKGAASTRPPPGGFQGYPRYTVLAADSLGSLLKATQPEELSLHGCPGLCSWVVARATRHGLLAMAGGRRYWGYFILGCFSGGRCLLDVLKGFSASFSRFLPVKRIFLLRRLN